MIGRFAHTQQYVRQVAHATGFEVISIETEVLRFDKGTPIQGFLVVLAPR